MRRLKLFWHSVFDVRPGEYLRLTFMTLYLLLVMFAYYILKPVSRALFLNKFDIEKLPYLTILVAFIGGILAYGYAHATVRHSLKKAVTLATLFSAGMLVGIWWLLRFNLPWMIYVFNIWVSLFSIVLVSQGWLIAANVFSPREAKRLYGILGVGAVLGAAFGGSFTAAVVPLVGTKNLMLASAVMVMLSYAAFLALLRLDGVTLSTVAAAGNEEVNFSLADILLAIRRHRHLQVIIAIITITFVVDVIIEYQFSAMAKQWYKGDQLTAFLGGFYGIYLNLITFVLQFFLTTFIVSRFGVGGTLQIMPVTIGLASLAALVLPGVASASCLRLAEAATRYSFNRTGMELLYLPLPRELKNSTKAFVDIFADRMARALGGILLLLLTVVLAMPAQKVAYVTVALSILWILLSIKARNEYVRTVTSRLEVRRLDLEDARVTVSDRETIQLLERTARQASPRQASYALGLLGDAPGYHAEALLRELATSPEPEVRAQVFRIARQQAVPDLVPAALAELRSARAADQKDSIPAAVEYALAVSPDTAKLASQILDHENPLAVEAAVLAVAGKPELLTTDWITAAAASPLPSRRRVAALAIGVRGDENTSVLHQLLQDTEASVIGAALEAAGKLQSRAYLGAVLRRLNDARVRGSALSALGLYGVKIVGTLADFLEDDKVSVSVRRQVPRVLQQIPDQRAVDVLIRNLKEPDLSVRSNVLRALSKLRVSAPDLDYGGDNITEHILDEARLYYQTSAAMQALQTRKPETKVAQLLVKTLQQRLQASIDRLFRLLGLQYPPTEIYAAYRALQRNTSEQSEDFSAAIEFLDNLLKPELRKLLLPLLDDDGEVHERGAAILGLSKQNLEETLNELMRSGDSWLVACAIGTAAEWDLKSLAPRIALLSKNAGAEIGPVAQAALEVLA